MNNNIRIAKQLVRIASDILTSSQKKLFKDLAKKAINLLQGKHDILNNGNELGKNDILGYAQNETFVVKSTDTEWGYVQLPGLLPGKTQSTFAENNYTATASLCAVQDDQQNSVTWNLRVHITGENTDEWFIDEDKTITINDINNKPVKWGMCADRQLCFSTINERGLYLSYNKKNDEMFTKEEVDKYLQLLKDKIITQMRKWFYDIYVNKIDK